MGPLRMPRTKISFMRVFLAAINVASTVLTLFSGLRENPVLVMVTGRYEPIRSRLLDGSINMEIAQDDITRLDRLTPLDQISNDFRFITAPRRDPSTIGEYRSVCTNLNSNNASVMGLVYDDFWGNGPRRVQIFVYSISAPKCKVLNVRTKWRDQCLSDRKGNATACYRYILDNFETLQDNRLIQVGTNKDFGERGVPFLKCLGRPEKPFPFQADLLAHQSYWAGGSYHIMIQTSQCMAKSLIRNADHKYGLFEAQGVDEGANVLLALPPNGWFANSVTVAYSVVSIVMIARGLIAAVFHSRLVLYLPKEVRYSKEHRFLRYVAPFMPVATTLTDLKTSIITFKGSLLIASDIWMNHWLYITLSILDAITNIRLTYVTLQVGTWMLNMKITAENFIFLCSAINKITWIMCLLHTMLRYVLKSIVHSLRTLHAIRSQTRERIDQYIDGIAMLIGYKLYNLLLCLILFIMLKVTGQSTFMVRANPYKVGMYGGIPEIARFWTSELVCDLSTILGILMGAGHFVGMILMTTRYRLVTRNKVMQLLQERYFFVGWDGLRSAQVLGLDPSDEDLVYNGHVYTKCSLGSLLQLLYQSGPSAFTHLAGDYIFVDSGFTKEVKKFAYPVKRAVAIGLCQTNRNTSSSKYAVSDAETLKVTMTTMTTLRNLITQRQTTVNEDKEMPMEMPNPSHSSMPTKQSIFNRELKMVMDGRLGKILLVDKAQPGSIHVNHETGQREYLVCDALSTIMILDIKWLLGNEKKLRIE